MFILLSGMLATGKTTLAAQLGRRLGLPVIHVDTFKRTIVEERPELLEHLRRGEEVPQEHLQRAFEMTGQALEALARSPGGSPGSCVVEEVFAREEDGLALARRSAQWFGPLVHIHTIASPTTVERRLEQRRQRGDHLVDVRYHQRMLARFEERRSAHYRYATDLDDVAQEQAFEDLVRSLTSDEPPSVEVRG